MLSLYNASKFALKGFSESLSYELRPQNIIVKIIEPGGVVSTSFGSRMQTESSQMAVAPSDYNDAIEAAKTVFAGLRAACLATAADVAQVIFEAATGNTDRFRYVATKDIEPFVKWRRETSEARYMEFMRSPYSLTATPAKNY